MMTWCRRALLVLIGLQLLGITLGDPKDGRLMVNAEAGKQIEYPSPAFAFALGGEMSSDVLEELANLPQDKIPLLNSRKGPTMAGFRLQEKRRYLTNLLASRVDPFAVTKDWSKEERGRYIFARMMKLPFPTDVYSTYRKTAGRQQSSPKANLANLDDVPNAKFYKGVYRLLLGRDPEYMEARVLDAYKNLQERVEKNTLISFSKPVFAISSVLFGVALIFSGLIIGGVFGYVISTATWEEEEDEPVGDKKKNQNMDGFQPLESTDDSSAESGGSDGGSDAEEEEESSAVEESNSSGDNKPEEQAEPPEKQLSELKKEKSSEEKPKKEKTEKLPPVEVKMSSSRQKKRRTSRHRSSKKVKPYRPIPVPLPNRGLSKQRAQVRSLGSSAVGSSV